MALLTRFIWGILNGTDPIVKTYIAEICEDKKDLARGISLLALSDGIGRMVGPTVSAWLSRPASKYSFLNVPLLRRFPYFLPSLVCASSGLVSVATAYLVLKETVAIDLRARAGKYSLMESKLDMNSGRGEYGESTKSIKSAPCLFTRRVVLSAILNYNYFAFIMIQFDELIPLMLVTPPKNGGFCMNENSLGFVTFCTSILQMPISLLVIPLIISFYGIRKSIKFGLLLIAILVFCLPFWTINNFVEDAFSIYSSPSLALNGSMLDANKSAIESCGRAGLGITDISPGIWLIFFSVQIPISLLRIFLFTGYTIRGI